jgi:hypothetical protein
MTSDFDTVNLEPANAQGEAALYTAILDDTPESAVEEPAQPATASGHRGMPFVVSFIQRWRRGSASMCTFCQQPFRDDEIYLRGELYTVEAKRWTWISLHEECVLQHALVQQYCTGAGSEDFRAWFREQELRR